MCHITGVALAVEDDQMSRQNSFYLRIAFCFGYRLEAGQIKNKQKYFQNDY
jgi:hypothetical protein